MGKIYDSLHQGNSIRTWIKYGIISDDYKKLYYYHMSINNCQLCNVLFDKTFKNQRCLDHDHNTGLYRKTLCRSCNATYEKAHRASKINSKSGHMWIYNHRTKGTSGNQNFTWKYNRYIINEFKKMKCFTSKTKCIALSFIYLLKYPNNL